VSGSSVADLDIAYARHRPLHKPIVDGFRARDGQVQSQLSRDPGSGQCHLTSPRLSRAAPPKSPSKPFSLVRAGPMPFSAGPTRRRDRGASVAIALLARLPLARHRRRGWSLRTPAARALFCADRRTTRSRDRRTADFATSSLENDGRLKNTRRQYPPQMPTILGKRACKTHYCLIYWAMW
jgi:hypothetical protein